MRNNPIIGLLIIIFIIYGWATHSPPAGSIQVTKVLSQVMPSSSLNDVIGCSVKDNGIYFESCVLRADPDVHEMNEVLVARGWVSTMNNRLGGQ